jgi:hypothetical protein
LKLRRVSILGASVGGIVDIVSSVVFAMPVLVFAMMRIDRTHIPKDQLTAAATAAIQHDPSLMVAGFFAGSAGSLLGGYIAALIAKHDETLNGAFSAWLCVATGIIGWNVVAADVPILNHLLGFVVSPAVGALGGYMRHFQKQFASKNLRASG